MSLTVCAASHASAQGAQHMTGAVVLCFAHPLSHHLARGQGSGFSYCIQCGLLTHQALADQGLVRKTRK